MNPYPDPSMFPVSGEAGDERKAYQPPRLCVVSLRPEEAVLGQCKTMNNGGFHGGVCSNFFSPCVQNFGS